MLGMWDYYLDSVLPSGTSVGTSILFSTDEELE